MTCPSWKRLVAHRYDGPAACEPAGWDEALEHLGSCADCRDEAYAADPTLLFRLVPEERVDASDVERMRAGVDALRRASRVEAEPCAGTPGRRRGALGAGRESRWNASVPTVARRAAAAAVLAAALLSVHPHESGSALPGAAPVDLQARLPGFHAAGMATSDDIDLPTASVYQLNDDDLALTMVVDPELDV